MIISLHIFVKSVQTACGQQIECPAGKYSYQIRSGVERDGSPTVCFNGHMYVNSVNRAALIDLCSRSLKVL